VEGHCVREVAGIWVVVFFGITYFGEINIFGLSKDQIFRIWSTFMNPEQFLLLVTYVDIYILLFWKATMPAFQKTSHFQEILDLKLVEGRCVWEMPREFGPCTFLVPPVFFHVYLFSILLNLTNTKKMGLVDLKKMTVDCWIFLKGSSPSYMFFDKININSRARENFIFKTLRVGSMNYCFKRPQPKFQP
jgi:hypothetical protein